MGLWSRIADFALRRSTDPVGSEIFGAWGEWGGSASGVAVNSFSAMQHVSVMACVSILAEDVAKLPLQPLIRLANGGNAPAKEHYLYKLLRKPNPWQTRLEFVEMMTAALVLRGNGYAVIIRDDRGKPIMLVPVHPDRVTIFEAPDGQYYFMVTRQGLHETAILRDMPMMIHSEDMFHLKWLSQWNSLLGLSRIGLIRESVGVAIAQEQMVGRLALNGAKPGGVLEAPNKLSKEVIDRIKESWNEAQGGWRNAGKTAILEEGLKWNALGMTMVDAEFIANRNWQLQDIARAFRVPLYKLGVPAEGGGPSLAQQDQEYLNTSIVGLCERWVAKLAHTFDLDAPSGIEADEGETFAEFDYESMFKADIQTRYNAYRVAIIGGFKKVNEIRRREGDPADPNGDVLLQPTSMAPLGWVPPSKGSGLGSDTTGAPASGGDGDSLKLPEA